MPASSIDTFTRVSHEALAVNIELTERHLTIENNAINIVHSLSPLLAAMFQYHVSVCKALHNMY